MADQDTPPKKTLTTIADSGKKRYQTASKPGFSGAVSDMVDAVANAVSLRQFRQRKYTINDAADNQSK